MGNQKERSYYDYALKRLEFELEWKHNRSQDIHHKLLNNIHRKKTLVKVQRFFILSTSIALTFTFFYLIFGHLNGQINLIETSFLSDRSISSGDDFKEGIHYNYKTINGEKHAVLTREGKENSVFPLDASKTIDLINGEPDIFLNIDKIGDNKIIDMQAIYSTTVIGTHISIHTQRHYDSIDERINMLLSHKNYPSNSYTTHEVEIENYRAVLQEPKTQLGRTYLSVVTNKYIYYFYYTGLTEEKNKLESSQLVKLAKLMNFENE